MKDTVCSSPRLSTMFRFFSTTVPTTLQKKYTDITRTRSSCVVCSIWGYSRDAPMTNYTDCRSWAHYGTVLHNLVAVATCYFLSAKRKYKQNNICRAVALTACTDAHSSLAQQGARMCMTVWDSPITSDRSLRLIWMPLRWTRKKKKSPTVREQAKTTTLTHTHTHTPTSKHAF